MLLEYSLRKLVVMEPFLYTLSGSKPISCTYYEHPFSSFNSCRPSNLLFAMGWKKWELYKNFLMPPRIRLWSEVSDGYTTIFIADLILCEETVRQHRDDFYNVLGKIPDVAELFGARTSFFDESLNGHSGLLGILLGFGRNNSWLYYEKYKGRKQMTKKQIQNIPRLPHIWQENLGARSWFRWFLPRSLDISGIKLPFFVGDPDSEESKNLKVRYLSERDKIIQYYQGKKFFEATLNLCQKTDSSITSGI